jgi:hypothetical protein
MMKNKLSPDIINGIRLDLFEHQPNLHLLVSDKGVEISGMFAVRSPDKKILDRYKILIKIPPGYPMDLPIVKETGGKIPRDIQYHINNDGTACILLPEDRWRSFPIEAPFSTYLNIPLYNFFLGQIVYRDQGKWPFGEWGHGLEGIYEYYFWLLNTRNKNVVHRFLHILSKYNFKKHYECPCGSGSLIRECCISKILDLRIKMSPYTVKQSMEKLNDYRPTYKKSRLIRI